MIRVIRGRMLRTKVLAGVLLVTIAVLTAFDVAGVTALRRYLYTQTDSQLRSILGLYRPFRLTFSQKARVTRPPSRGKHVPRGAQAIFERGPGTVKFPGPPGFMIIGPQLLHAPPRLDQYLVEFVPGSGRGPRLIIAGNPDLQPRLPVNLVQLAVHQRAETLASSNGHAQLRMLSIREGPASLLATTSLSGVSKTIGRLELILIIGSAGAALLAAFGAAIVLRRGLRPIETMANRADRITAGDLTDRVGPDDTRTEVGRLGAALNGMLGRIETSVREREAIQELTNRFFADASHELRTPLASLRANAELYQQGALRDKAQVDEAMRRIVIESVRMGKLVDDMLKLARLDQQPGQECEPVDLTALVTDCVEQAKVADPSHSWRTRIASDLVADGDAELLRRAISNLLGNVRTHTPEGTAAMVTAARANGTITVGVSDDGPGVPADQLPRIFDRFYRGAAPSPRPGTGLGLAIVAAIAAAHDGTAEATPNSPRGLSVTLKLPASGVRPEPLMANLADGA
jgi:two-component system, OmpR family, sensor kinase